MNKRLSKPPILRISALIGVILVLAAFFVVTNSRKSRPAEALSARGGEPISTLIDVPNFQQFDPQWKDKMLAKTSSTMGNYGCTVCATAMALHAKGIHLNPDELNQALNRHNGFTESGLLIWKGIENVTDGRYKIILNSNPTHKTLDRELSRGNPIIAKVLYNRSIWHWVLITGKNDLDYLIQDPLSAKGSAETMKQYPEGFFAIRYLVEK